MTFQLFTAVPHFIILRPLTASFIILPVAGSIAPTFLPTLSKNFDFTVQVVPRVLPPLRAYLNNPNNLLFVDISIGRDARESYDRDVDDQEHEEVALFG